MVLSEESCKQRRLYNQIGLCSRRKVDLQDKRRGEREEWNQEGEKINLDADHREVMNRSYSGMPLLTLLLSSLIIDRGDSR
jgi:hypothetical protein